VNDEHLNETGLGPGLGPTQAISPGEAAGAVIGRITGSDFGPRLCSEPARPGRLYQAWGKPAKAAEWKKN
jgi:hypothetical protein